MRERVRYALVVGFRGGLQVAISDVLARHGFAVSTALETEQATQRFATDVPNLVVVTGRCGVEAILSLIAALPVPRTTRVVVLLPGPDPHAEREYRAAGVRVVLRMPVNAEDLVKRLVAPPTETTG